MCIVGLLTKTSNKITDLARVDFSWAAYDDRIKITLKSLADGTIMDAYLDSCGNPFGEVFNLTAKLTTNVTYTVCGSDDLACRLLRILFTRMMLHLE